MVERKVQKQREKDPYGKEDPLKNPEPPKRGTGRKAGTAKEPKGPDNRLTEEERRKRHKEKAKKS